MDKKSKNLSIGCHVSIAGGLWKAPENAAKLNCETFQIFSRSPHGGPVAEITPEIQKQFREAMDQYGLSDFVIHAPYIINFGSSRPQTFHGSISIIRGELERGSLLGARYVMFHPGSIKDNENGFKQAKDGIAEVLKGYKGTTQLLIEISAGAGQVIGDTFEEVADLMSPVADKKGFGGICFDTQHAFGSGYDMRTQASVDKVFKEFDKFIGLSFLKMSHVNDSKVELGSHKDRHEHIGEGLIGEKGFSAFLEFLNKKKLALPLILETEHDKVETDIKILKKLRDKVKG
jgi:deoxyribonuclease-4